MKKLLFCFLFVGFSLIANAQTANDSVKQVVNNLFAAMKNSNAEELLKCFADSAILQTIVKNKNGIISVKNELLADFVKQIGGLPVGVADERIVFDEIKVDKVLAIAWTPYQFYYKGNFSHCGTNHFVLIKQNNEWKIQYLIDTRRRDDCKVD